jgi:leader peptidase (prepilin peptidase) / N-methyltransferase
MDANIMQKIVVPLVLIIPGWGIGALINYLADTLPKSRKLTFPVCPHCTESWNWRNFLLLKKCNNCDISPPTRHRDTLFISTIVVLLMWTYSPPRINFIWAVLILAYLGLVFIIDIENRLILHPVSLVGIIIFSVYGIIHHGFVPTFLGALAGFGIMLALYYFGFLFSKLVSKIRKQPVEEVALGFGDVALSTVLGCLLGWPGITLGLMLAIILGGLFSLIYILIKMAQKKYHLLTAIPYGPFLIISAIVLLFRY